LLVALAMVCLRIWPPLLRLAAKLFQYLRGLVLPLSLLRMARDPLPPSRVVLLVSLTAGLVLFARAFRDSLAYRQEALARHDVLAKGISNALQLNALALVLFSVATFFLVTLVAVQGRGRSPAGAGPQTGEGEFNVLRMMGLSTRQRLALVGIDGLLVLLLGLLAGAPVGLGLSYIMIPYLSQALAGSLAGVAAERTAVAWPAIVRLFGLLAVVYGAALGILLGVLWWQGKRRPPTQSQKPGF
jgi:hypothetical protein